MSACDVRMSWEESWEDKSDEAVRGDIRWVNSEVFRKRIGPPYNPLHHDYNAARCAVLREARRRGLDPTETES